jgi:hypothetical protein
MNAVRGGIIETLGMGSSTSLGDMPALRFADTDGFAVEALRVAIVALEIRRWFVVGENGGRDHDDTKGEKAYEFHDVVDLESDSLDFCVYWKR